MMLSAPPLACLYCKSSCAGDEKAYVLTLLYKMHIMVLVIVAVAYLFDRALFCLDTENFCKLQMEHMDTCDSRNEYFML